MRPTLPALALIAIGFANGAESVPTLDGRPPLVIAHRGACGALPEETVEAYEGAAVMGADVLEEDLQLTKDGVLIARHDPNLAPSTNVASIARFADRKKSLSVDGELQDGWFVFDFTLEEIRSLGGISTAPERPHQFDGKFRIATFQEIIDIAKAKSTSSHRIAVYPETKNPTFQREHGRSLEDSLLAVLERNGWNRPDAPVFVQSFEPGSLRSLRAKGLKTKVVQLIDAKDADLRTGKLVYAVPNDRPFDWTRAGDTLRTYAWMTTPEGLAWIRTYADGIGPWKRYIVSLKGDLDTAGKVVDQNHDGKIDDRDGHCLAPTRLISDAHKAGLFVHPYTFRNEKRRLCAEYAGDPAAEYLQFYRLGVDGLFSDFADTALAARGRFLSEKRPAGSR